MSEKGVLSILLIGMRFLGSEVFSKGGGGAFLKKIQKMCHIF